MGSPSMHGARQPLLIDAFIAKLAVERLDECVLRRFAWLNNFSVTPLPYAHWSSARLVSSIPAPAPPRSALGIALETRCLVQRSCDIQAKDGVIHDDIDSLLSEMVDDSQALQTATIYE